MENINSEAIFYSGSSTTRGGHKITLQVPDREIVDALEAIGAGKRYMLALVPIADDEQPDVDAMAKVEKPKRRWTDLKLSQQAGILCNDEQFQDFASLNSPDGKPYSGKEYICDECFIASRSDLDRNPEAAEKFQRILTTFDAYRGRLPRP